MESNKNPKLDALPQAENEENTQITPDESMTIPIKFNKEVKELTVSEASVLAQKGMKFELIEKDFEELKKIALKNEKSIPEFLKGLINGEYESRKMDLSQKCQDEALVEKIINLENEALQNRTDGFEEVKKYFPKIKQIEDLPESVRESSKLKGTLLLDEYLRYKLEQKMRQEKSIFEQQKAAVSSVGSQTSKYSSLEPAFEEFIKGLWR